MGLVLQITAPDALMTTAMKLTGRIIANPIRALRLTKRLLRQAQHQSMNNVLEVSAAFQAIVHETVDHAEAVDALLDKRPLVFIGD